MKVSESEALLTEMWSCRQCIELPVHGLARIWITILFFKFLNGLLELSDDYFYWIDCVCQPLLLICHNLSFLYQYDMFQNIKNECTQLVVIFFRPVKGNRGEHFVHDQRFDDTSWFCNIYSTWFCFTFGICMMNVCKINFWVFNKPHVLVPQGFWFFFQTSLRKININLWLILI